MDSCWRRPSGTPSNTLACGRDEKLLTMSARRIRAVRAARADRAAQRNRSRGRAVSPEPRIAAFAPAAQSPERLPRRFSGGKVRRPRSRSTPAPPATEEAASSPIRPVSVAGRWPYALSTEIPRMPYTRPVYVAPTAVRAAIAARCAPSCSPRRPPAGSVPAQGIRGLPARLREQAPRDRRRRA